MLKLNVGFSRKSGEPNYGSRGASVHLELELDSALVSDSDRLKERIRHLFGLAKASVTEELRGSPGHNGAPAGCAAGSALESTALESTAATNGHEAGQLSGIPAAASRRQIEYAQKLAAQIRGIGTNRLDALAENLFLKPLADLTSLDASGLIDRLKAIRAGQVGVPAEWSELPS